MARVSNANGRGLFFDLAREKSRPTGEMTQQYLLGELSLILAELQTVATNEAAVRDVARLRREAETGPLAALASVAARALELTDDWCWDSLVRGDPAAFSRQAALFAELWEFAFCANLVDDR